MKDILLRIGEDALRRTSAFNLSEIEFYLQQRKSLEITVEDGSIRSVSSKNDQGCGIRSIIDKKIGFSYVTTLEASDIDDTVNASLSLANVSSIDSDFHRLPASESKYNQVKDIFDPSLDTISSEDAADLVMRIVHATHETLKGLEPKIEGIFHVTNTTVALVNSHGISESMCSTQIMAEFDSTIRIDGDQANSYDDFYSCTLSGFNPEALGENIGIRTKRMTGAKKIEDGMMPLVLSPFSVSNILKFGLIEAIKASNVQMGQSFLSDRLNTDIGSELLTVHDDALLTGGINSRVFDAEGYPSQTTQLIQDGVLDTFLHDSYTSNKDNVENTGNATRRTYQELPSISSSNLVVRSGKGTEDDLIADIKKGVYCTITGDRPDLQSGDLNAVIMEGHFIQEGELVHPLLNTIFSINLIDLLKGITRIGGNDKVTGFAVCPSIVVEKVKVSSG